ncbi:MAG: low affinity iron permease family protein [Chthoniobacterales bacterium]
MRARIHRPAQTLHSYTQALGPERYSIINTPKRTKNGKARATKADPEERSFVCRVQDAFRVFARGASAVLGTAWAFVIAIATIVIWAATGHIFGYSDTWQLIINTGTTIVTFLMVFLIQNTQNRDSKAIHLKLDELIRALRGARNGFMDLEKMSDEELKALEEEFEKVSKRAAKASDRIEEVQEAKR